MIMGTLRAADDPTTPIPATDVVLLERSDTDSLVRHGAVTSDLGRYAFCGAANGSPVWLVARVGTEWTEPYLVHPDSARPVEIVPLRGPSLASPPDSGAPSGAPAVILGRTLVSGTASRITGWVLQPENSNATIQVLVDNVVRATVAKDGSFAVNQVPQGSRRVSFRSARLAVRHITLMLEPGQSHLLLVTLREAPIVVVRHPNPVFDERMAEFGRRRRTGNGVFLDRSEIEKRNPRTLTDLLRTVPGIRIAPTQRGNRFVSSHFRRYTQGAAGPESAMCDVMFYLDGQPYPMENGEADGRIPVTEIAALEAYLTAGSVPRQYAGTNAACGVILIWRG